MGFRARAVLAVCVATVLCVAMVQPAFAQDDTATEDQYAPGPDDECPGAEVVNTTPGTGPKESAPFPIAGERFRITIVNKATSNDPSLSGVTVFVNETNGDAVSDFSQEGEGTDSSIINAGPGSFFIETNPANASYVVVVEDCVDTEGNPPVSPGDTNDPADVVDGTIPDKPLPDTGGLPLAGLVVIGLALVGIGGSIVRAGVERRS